jgi:hypothetical protein
MGHDVICFLDRHISPRRAGISPRRAGPTQEIDQLLARDGIDPRRQQLRWVVVMSLDMDGQQRILNQIFGVRYASPDARQLAFVISAQMATQPFEQRAVRRRIAIEARKHQRLEFRFAGRHRALSLVIRRWSGFGYSSGLHPISETR